MTKLLDPTQVDEQGSSIDGHFKIRDNSGIKVLPGKYQQLTNPNVAAYHSVICRDNYYTTYYSPKYYKYTAPVYSLYYAYTPAYYHYTPAYYSKYYNYIAPYYFYHAATYSYYKNSSLYYVYHDQTYTYYKLYHAATYAYYSYDRLYAYYKSGVYYSTYISSEYRCSDEWDMLYMMPWSASCLNLSQDEADPKYTPPVDRWWYNDMDRGYYYENVYLDGLFAYIIWDSTDDRIIGKAYIRHYNDTIRYENAIVYVQTRFMNWNEAYITGLLWGYYRYYGYNYTHMYNRYNTSYTYYYYQSKVNTYAYYSIYTHYYYQSYNTSYTYYAYTAAKYYYNTALVTPEAYAYTPAYYAYYVKTVTPAYYAYTADYYRNELHYRYYNV